MLSAQNYSADDGLNDGKPVIIRSITRTDRAKILTAFEQLDSDSIYSRFFTLKKALSDGDISGLTELGPTQGAALVVTRSDHLLGGGRYVSDRAHRSGELAFITATEYRGRGLATLVLRHLINLARQDGLESFEAYVLSQNLAMRSVSTMWAANGQRVGR